MRTFDLHTSVRLPLPLSQVFPFFSDAYNLETLTPPWVRFSVLTPRPITMGVGTEIDYQLKIHGIPVRWRSAITAWEPPFRFVDEQLRGPYSLWVHEHRFREEDGQTVAEDHVRYAVPGGALVHNLFVRRDVERIFAFRQQKMQELFGRIESGRAA
ncbi:MAG: SRPBCC family protein [Bryobacterales bacterium]